jgi:ParB family chromosome partitioning protein
MIPVDRIEVLNTRERNGKVFEKIVGNIKTIGLKKPVGAERELTHF